LNEESRRDGDIGHGSAGLLSRPPRFILGLKEPLVTSRKVSSIFPAPKRVESDNKTDDRSGAVGVTE
jgi:hypothetical protein